MLYVDLVRQAFTRRTGLSPMLIVSALAIALLVAVQLACTAQGIDPGMVTRDPAALVKAPFYTGVLSTLGIGCWGAAIALAVFGWLLFRGSGDAVSREVAASLGTFALFSAWLGMDDLVQVHEYVAPVIFHVKEHVVYLSYVIFAGLWMLRYRRVLLERAPLPLLLAFGGFAGSIAADVYGDWYTELPIMIEDGLKLVGLVNWAAWVGVVVWTELASLRRVAAEPSLASASAVEPRPKAASAGAAR